MKSKNYTYKCPHCQSKNKALMGSIKVSQKDIQYHTFKLKYKCQTCGIDAQLEIKMQFSGLESEEEQ